LSLFLSVKTARQAPSNPWNSCTIQIVFVLYRVVRVLHVLFQIARACPGWGINLVLSLQVVKERDTIGSQLIRRNDEVTLLYEKVKIMELTLHKGELQYKERLEDLRILKLEIRRLRCKNNMLQKSSESGDDLRLPAGVLLDTA